MVGCCSPHLNRDTKKEKFSGTPNERWVKYLDSIGIADTHRVFHSFRSTSNTRLKQNGVAEETRCHFIGHEHDTVNSRNYSEHHSVAFLIEHVASKLGFTLRFESLRHPRDAIVKTTKRKMELKRRLRRHKEATAKRNHQPTAK